MPRKELIAPMVAHEAMPDTPEKAAGSSPPALEDESQFFLDPADLNTTPLAVSTGKLDKVTTALAVYQPRVTVTSPKKIKLNPESLAQFEEYSRRDILIDILRDVSYILFIWKCRGKC